MKLVIKARTLSVFASIITTIVCSPSSLRSASAHPTPPARCTLPVLANIKVDPLANAPLVSGEINGRKVKLVVGLSSHTAVYRSAAKDLGILVEDGNDRAIRGPSFSQIGFGWVHDLELDGVPREVLSSYDVHEDFRVAVEDSGAARTPSPSAVLGAQFWSLADDDFDLRAGNISIVRPAGCSREDALPFNGGAYSQTPLLTPSTRAIDYIVTVRVDGIPLRAEIDTGTNTTILTRQGATKLSHDWPLPNAKPQGGFTAGQETFSWSKARFKTFNIGDETIQNPTIVVADIYGRDQVQKVRLLNGTFRYLQPYRPLSDAVPDMILGADFFRAHHVLVSNSRRMVYFAYNETPFLS